eukprot:TRINITY_DN8719_c0_g1_i1.p2 TRINITY_DN8719_c0_g1~~TRINITY_DN8719_c0_g1_i1.p2  ORF type:complete len:142 (-),score=50.12 TRINITY_DN8719_c0_g1_i1:526-951(-)
MPFFWNSVLALVWSGANIGLSFIATPAKFRAPTLDRPTALDVGLVTFHTYNAVEWALGATSLLLTRGALRGPMLAAQLAVMGIVAAETFLLLPPLDARVRDIQRGVTPAPSNLHGIYVAAEAAKVALLFGSGIAGLRMLRR